MQVVPASFVPVPVFADAGVPMIFLTLPAMVILLAPIIVLEALLCRRWLGLSYWESLKANMASNIASTIVGIPVAWFAMFLFEVSVGSALSQIPRLSRSDSPLVKLVWVIVGAAWTGGDVEWMVPLSVLVLLVPFFLISYASEYFVMNQMISLPEGDPSARTSSNVRSAVRDANLITYGFLFAGAAAWLLMSLPR